MRELVEQAVLAPSSHNTQPWAFRIDGDRVELRADRRRSLPRNDPDGRELVISCGAALLNLRVAAEHAGLALDVSSLPSDDVLATAAVVGERTPGRLGALQDAIVQRRTYRRPFLDRPVHAYVTRRLMDAAADEGATLQVLEGSVRETFLELVAEGDRRQFADPRWRRELASWIHTRRKHDGLVYPEVTAPAARLVVRHMDVGRSTAHRDVDLAAGAPLLALLVTEDDDRSAWLRAGQALERVLLTAAAAGVQASFLNQPLQLAPLRPQVRELLTVPGAPQVGLRLGYPAEPVRPAPRRGIDDVLIAG